MSLVDTSSDKWARIKAAREHRIQNEEIEVEEISALNLVEAILEERPGNFKTIFEQLMQDRLEDLVSTAKQHFASRLVMGEQEELEEEDEEEEGDESDELTDQEVDEIIDQLTPEEIESLTNEAEDEEELEEASRLINKTHKKEKNPREFANKVMMARRGKIKEQDSFLRGKGTTIPGGAGHLPGPKDDSHAKMTKIHMPSKEGGCETDFTNTKPHTHSSKGGNSEKKAHQLMTLARLKSMSKATSNDKV